MGLFGRKTEPPDPETTTAVVLAGGASSRFGTQKGLARLDGRPLVAWVVTAAGAAARSSVLVLEPDEAHDAWERAVGATGAEATIGIVHDDVRHQGPVAGLRAAAPRVETPFAFLLAVDMPLVRPDLLLGLMPRLSGHDAVAFHMDGWWCPLPGLWRTASLREALVRAQAEDVNSLRGLCDLLDTRPLGKEFLELFSNEARDLQSVNTPEDLAEAERRLAERRKAGGAATAPGP